MKNKKIIILLALVFLLTTFTVGCGNKDTSSNESSDAAISFVDDEGNQINLNEPCSRIISFYSAHTENLFTLGAGDKIIGNYKTGIYPAAAAKIEIYDYHSDPEKIIAADPDCVIIRPFITRNVPEFVEAIKNAGITVVSLYPESNDDFEEYINKLAMVAGVEDEAKVQLELLDSRMNDLSEITSAIPKKQRHSIFFESTEVNLRTVTPDSMVGNAIEIAGGINIASEAESIEKGSSIAVFGEEAILEQADNIDVYVSQRGAMNSGGSLQGISERPGFEVVKAVKEGKVYIINEKIMSSPTFRQYKGARELARFLYPEIMDDYSEYENQQVATREDMAYITVKVAHIPLWVPSSSRYYNEEYKNHTFGMFEDVDWRDDSFDYIETATMAGGMKGFHEEDKEYFKPEQKMTREELAEAVITLGDLKAQSYSINISDLEKCENGRMVQMVVDNKIMKLQNGKFNPGGEVTNQEIIDALKMVVDAN
ncbi:MAG: ABC transporter substrate-binding protein [Clostridiales bacterium]|nr:ABC transporter substrate-binding protein [Clostridiales bacterium]